MRKKIANPQAVSIKSDQVGRKHVASNRVTSRGRENGKSICSQSSSVQCPSFMDFRSEKYISPFKYMLALLPPHVQRKDSRKDMLACPSFSVSLRKVHECDWDFWCNFSASLNPISLFFHFLGAPLCAFQSILISFNVLL